MKEQLWLRVEDRRGAPDRATHNRTVWGADARHGGSRLKVVELFPPEAVGLPPQGVGVWGVFHGGLPWAF